MWYQPLEEELLAGPVRNVLVIMASYIRLEWREVWRRGSAGGSRPAGDRILHFGVQGAVARLEVDEPAGRQSQEAALIRYHSHPK